VLAICRILYSHRVRYNEDKDIVDLQKGVLNDTSLKYGATDMRTILERVTKKTEYVVYNDGEGTGKVFSNALLSHRLELFRFLLESNSSFDQPRRLWQCHKHQVSPRGHDCCDLAKVSDDDISNGKEMFPSLSIDGTWHPIAPRCLEIHEDIIKHLFSLCCHPNLLVRGTSLNVSFNRTFVRISALSVRLISIVTIR